MAQLGSALQGGHQPKSADVIKALTHSDFGSKAIAIIYYLRPLQTVLLVNLNLKRDPFPHLYRLFCCPTTGCKIKQLDCTGGHIFGKRPVPWPTGTPTVRQSSGFLSLKASYDFFQVPTLKLLTCLFPDFSLWSAFGFFPFGVSFARAFCFFINWHKKASVSIWSTSNKWKTN